MQYSDVLVRSMPVERNFNLAVSSKTNDERRSGLSRIAVQNSHLGALENGFPSQIER
jgi:hypothetical protein